MQHEQKINWGFICLFLWLEENYSLVWPLRSAPKRTVCSPLNACEGQWYWQVYKSNSWSPDKFLLQRLCICFILFFEREEATPKPRAAKTLLFLDLEIGLLAFNAKLNNPKEPAQDNSRSSSNFETTTCRGHALSLTVFCCTSKVVPRGPSRSVSVRSIWTVMESRFRS